MKTLITRFILLHKEKAFVFSAVLLLWIGSTGKIYGQNTTHTYSDLESLVSHLMFYCFDGTNITLESGNAVASAGDMIKPSTPNLTINLDNLSQITSQSNCTGTIILPLVIPQGVTLEGDYDLLAESYTDPLGNTIITGPNGTMITSSKRWENMNTGGNSTNDDEINLAFMFQMEHSTDPLKRTTIRNIRIKGDEYHWQDFNNDNWLCGGVFINGIPGGTLIGENYRVTNCEISGFSYAGIHCNRNTDEITIENCYIHRVKGIRTTINPLGPSGHTAIAYGIWIQSASIETNIYLSNNIYDNCKASIDGQAGPENWIIRNSTFASGINRHNGWEGFPYQHPFSTISGCEFYNKTYYGLYPDNIANPVCAPADNTSLFIPYHFDVFDHAGGDADIQNSIFHDVGCSFPYPATGFGAKEITYSWLTPGTNPVTYLCQNGSNNNTNLIDPSVPVDLDNNGWNVALPFQAFDFFGFPYTDCLVCTNGFIKFGTNTAGYNVIPSPADKIPSDNDPDNYIALCWTDLEPDALGSNANIKYWTDVSGGAGNFVFVVEYEAVPYIGTISETITGQILLFESTGFVNIVVQNDNISNPVKKILGVENNNGTVGTTPSDKNFDDWTEANKTWQFFNPDFHAITVLDNTFSKSPNTNVTCPSGSPPNQTKGYAAVADNWIEDCVWNDDANIVWETSPGSGIPDNSFSYLPGVPVNNNTGPQPPEVNLILQDASNTNLPVNTDGVPYITGTGTQIKIAELLTPPPLGSTDKTYIIRPNPNKGIPCCNNHLLTTSSNNNFFNEQYISTPSTPLASFAIQYDNGTFIPGLYGIDALATARDEILSPNNPYWAKKIASAWTHYPVIVVPQVSVNGIIESHLVFNIMDSYKTPIDPSTGFPILTTPAATGILKAARLNGNIIWSEDIAHGGDGWERVAIDYSTLIQNLNVNGQNNLSFSIDLPASVNAIDYRGVMVWVDDVYINKYGSATGENIINDGNIESCISLASGNGSNDCSWYRTPPASTCTLCIANLSEPLNLPDGNYLEPEGSGLTPIRASAEISTSVRERKSGRQSIQMTLPQLPNDPVNCSNYNNCIPAITVSTDFNFPTPFCRQGGGYIDLTVTSNNELYGPISAGNYNLNPNPLSGNTIITLGNDVTIDASNIAIAKDVTINTNGYVLTIQNGSHLFSCGDMWQGIINDGGAIIIDGSVVSNTILDAIEAVHSENGYPVEIINSYFNHNRVSISLINGNYSSSIIYGNTFDNTGTELPKAPYAGQDPPYHIYTNNADPVTIGFADQSASPNIFRNAINGIFSVVSNLTAVNNEFYNIGNDNFQNRIPAPPAPPYTTPNAAIKASGSSTTTYTLTVGTGNTGSYEFNKFFDCETAVFGNRDIEAHVNFNEIKQTINAPLTPRINGIRFEFIRSRAVEITNNILDRYLNGISVFNVTGSPVTISDNQLNLIAGYNIDYIGLKAIDVENYTMNHGQYSIKNNEIKNTQYGIHLRNLYVCLVCGANFINVDDNIIKENIPEADLLTSGLPHFGIFADNCQYASITSNDIRWTAGTIDNVNGSLLLPLLTGIYIQDNLRSTVQQNYIKNMAGGIDFINNCSATNLYCNTMDHCYHGVFLDIQNGINTTVTDQGEVHYNGIGQYDPTTSIGWKNKWMDAVPGIDRVASNGSVIPFFWLYKLTQTYYVPITSVFGISTQLCNNDLPWCDPPLVLDDDERERAFGDAVNDSTVNDPDSLDFKYNREKTFYVIAKADTSILYLGASSDIVYQQEFDSLAQTNIGKYEEVKEYFQNNESQLAQQLLSTITDQNLQEQNLKYIYGLIAAGYDPALDDDSDTVSVVSSIAWQHPFYGGEAVFMARAMLHLIIIDVAPPARIAHVKQNEFAASNIAKGKLFPNPAHNEITFTCPPSNNETVSLRVCDLFGREISSMKLTENEIKFKINDYLQSVYFVHVYLNGTETETHRFVIIR